MKPKNNILQHLGFIALAFAGLSANSAQAASQTWTNSASDSLWNTTSADWTGAVWTNNNDAVFGATGVGSIAVASGVIVNDITFSTTGYTLTGDLMLANDQASTFTLNANETISAIIANNTAGASSLTKAGGSTLTLSGANTYTGATTINAGTVTLSGSISSSSALALGGGTLSYTKTGTNTQTFASTAVNAGNSTVTNATATNIVDLAAMTRSGNGLLNISSLTGTTKTSNAVDSTGILGTWISTGTGTSLKYAAGGSGGAITAYTGTAAATAANVTDTTGAVNYDVAAVGALGASASFNTLRYTGAAGSITGDFTANGLMNAGSGAATYSGNVTIGASKELVILGNTQGTTLSGVISNNGAGASSITYGGPSAGTLTLSGANTHTGGTILTAGTLVIGNNSAFGTGALTLNGGTLKGGVSNWALANNISVGGSTTIDEAGKNLDWNGNLSGSAALSVASGTNTAATLNLSGDNSGYSGTITFSNALQGNAVSFTSANAGSAGAAWVFNDNRGDRVRIGIAGGGTIAFGSMAGAGQIQNDVSATTSTISVGALSTSTTFSGTMKNNGTGILALTKVGTGTWTLSGANTYTGATNVTGGTLQIGNGTAGSIAGGSAVTMGVSGTLALNFPAATTTFANSLTNNGILSTISGNSLTLSGTINGTGSITKADAGTLTLSGGGDLSGAANISAGTLKVNSVFGNCGVTLGAASLGGNGSVGAVTVNNTGAVITNGNANTDTLTLGSLVFSTGATLNLNKFNDTGTPALSVTGNLTTASGITVNIPTPPPVWSNGTYNLISYGSFTGSVSHLTEGTIPGLGGRQSATLGSTGASNGFITLTIAGDSPYWTGANDNTWTTSVMTAPKNWKLVTGGTTTDFQDNDQVLFNDNATGSTTVNISAANVQVEGVIFDNTSNDYTISSTGGFGISDFSSPAVLIKNGFGTVTLTTTNSYTGATTINAGTLQLGDGTTNGDIASSSGIANDGTLVFNRNGGSFTYGNVISGFGQVIKNGSGTQILAGANTLSGDTTINAGTLQVGNAGTTGSLGAGSITNNGSLVFNRSNAVVQGTDFGLIDGTGSLTQSGSGTLKLAYGNSYSGGSTINSGTILVGGNDALGTGTVNLAGGTLGVTDGNYALSNAVVAQTSTTSVLTTNGTNLTLNGNLSGSGNLNRTATGVAASVFLNGDNSGFSGTFTVDSNASAATRLISATSGSANAKWVINQATSTRASVDSPGNTIHFGSLTGTGFLTVEVTGTTTIQVGNLGLTESFTGVLNQLSGGSILAVTKVGAGTWTLTGTNTYTGATAVNAGTLALGATGSIATSSGVTIAAGSTLDVTAATPFAMSSTQTVTFKVDGSGAGSSGLLKAAALNITNAHVAFTVVNPLDDNAYVLASYTSLTGSAFASVTPPTGYTINYTYNSGTQIALVKAAGYDSWATNKGLTGANNGPLQDPNNNGISNLMEYALNGDPLNGESPASILPTEDSSGPNLVFDFHRLHDSASDTTQVFQYGSDLTGWTDVAIPASGTVGIVAVTADSATIDHVTVTVPKGVNTKLFGRLHVTKP